MVTQQGSIRHLKKGATSPLHHAEDLQLKRHTRGGSNCMKLQASFILLAGSGNNPNQSTEVDASMVAAAGAGDDSDYYTPEDPATTILSPLHTDKERTIASSAPTSNPPSVESTPGRWIGMREGLMVSMPGTPLSTTSHISNRSSGDSYSSSSSTRQLLAAASSHQNSSDNQEKTLQL
ncbi:uncharacterized protein [Anabrus simplex]|uniref:uncharacterized protein n=1 Tax=Anabrus simplex TaxID=316456 RepID=UPI0035A3CFBB